MSATEELTSSLRAYFASEPAVILSFLFGSAASGRMMAESDVDVAVYLSDVAFEGRIWAEASEAVRRDVDLMVMNDAPETMVSAVLKTGIPLAVKDDGLFWRLLLAATAEAEDFALFAQDFERIRLRSSSLSPEDRTRLVRRLGFLREELRELPDFAALTLEQYRTSRPRRREIERWAENVVNALVDIAKIVLASHGEPVPQSYADALRELGSKAGMPPLEARELSELARLRNLLAHEYLELLYERIRFLIDAGPKLLARVLPYVDACLGERLFPSPRRGEP